MKNFSGVCQAAGADKPLRAFFIWITNIVTLWTYSQASKLPEEKLTSEFKAVLAIYGQKVGYVDLNSVEPLIDAITSQNGISIH